MTLDIDATAILCDKWEARYTYQKERGYIPVVGHIREAGVIVSQQFRHGNVPPSKDNLGFIVQCGEALPKWGQQSLDVGCGVGTDTYEHGGYVYRAIATNRDALSDREVIHWYNQRGEHSEHRIKELKCDFGGGWLPCGQFSANELYFALCALSNNLFALLRHLLPGSWSRSRAPTVRWRLIALAGQLVYHGRQWTLKLRPAHHAVLNAALSHVRRFALAP